MRSNVYTEYFDYAPKYLSICTISHKIIVQNICRLETFKSCPNIKMDVIQENIDVDDSEWKTLIPLIIDSCVEKKRRSMCYTGSITFCHFHY